LITKEERDQTLAAFSSAIKVSTASSYQTYSNGTRKFAKFFLISDKENLKKWQVTPESIPRRINTFIGMPFVSEPELAHFGADDMPLDEILRVQEKWRAGTIVDVQFNPQTMQAFAIVEFLDNALGQETWKELNEGKAVYVSPAVAGSGKRTATGVNLFLDWIGIHLARVKSPAYGVFHASIKSSCEGNERECIRNLMASASNFINDSFNIVGFSSCKNMSKQEQIQSAMTDEELKKDMASLKSEMASVKTAFEKLGGEANPDTKPVPDPSLKSGQTTPVTDPIVDPQNHSVGSANEKEFENVKTKLASYEKKFAAASLEKLVTLKASAGVYSSAAEEEADKKKFEGATEEDIEKEIASITPLLQKLASANEAAGRLANTPNRVISSVASASIEGKGITSLDDLRKRGLI